MNDIDLTIPDFLDRKNPVCIALLNAVVLIALLISVTPAAAHPDSGKHCHINNTHKCH